MERNAMKVSDDKYETDIYIVVPAYNEGQAITSVLDQLIMLPYNVIVVDDGSSDDTPHIASRYPVVLLRHAFNLGQGAALQTGIDFAIMQRDAKFIVTFDSDGQHDIKDIENLLGPLKSGQYDITLGSRFIRAGTVHNMNLQRYLLLKLAIAFTRLTTGLYLTDTHNGLRAFTLDSAKKIFITQNRMAHASELLSQIAKENLRYCEVPVTVTYTPYSLKKGQSIFNSINILLDLVMEKMR
jgi:polyprenyl-phospho-N-acetylgalactosaminyl synthase